MTLSPLTLDPTAEQVQLNTQALHTLVAQVENLEKKLSESCQNRIAQSYASVASAPASESNPTPPLDVSRSSDKSSSQIDSRASNLILFGLHEKNSLLEVKNVVDELLEFLGGTPIKVNDLFWLGKFSTSSSRPRPVLIKLATAWDRKIILLRRRNLKIPHLFLREDVPPDHRLRQRILKAHIYD